MKKTLSAFIREHGDETAAEILSCTTRSCKAYRLFQRFPRPEQAIEFLGRVDWDVIESMREFVTHRNTS